MTPHTPEEAEQALRDAIDSGDPARIAAAEADVERLDNPKPLVPLMSSALWYASHDIPVFRLLAGRKHPFPGSHGLKDATTDLDQIRAWWSRTPEANIGLATGHKFDVVDIDGPLGQKSRAEHWDSVFATIDASQIAKVLTPRPGGMHIYVPATGDGNGAGIAPGVDYRGQGGYVVAPPSVIPAGSKDHPGRYRFLGTPAFTTLGGAA
ncbi:bifunctional DNA primase/polymerase [Nocardioides sp. REDSEA-S30_B4]|uniref:bifunctional DNA primase/polymerase n=1 Tax=Nocardioides sp. REDSEA-S30_B4 TaxID=1811552 RepID=UPI000AA55728|nr:bifunctional DNA primase/polymerase [Nocardioides sp. REDSEA-S30_B4]